VNYRPRLRPPTVWDRIGEVAAALLWLGIFAGLVGFFYTAVILLINAFNSLQ